MPTKTVPQKDELVKELAGDLAMACSFVKRLGEHRLKDNGIASDAFYGALMRGSKAVLEEFRKAGIDVSQSAANPNASDTVKASISSLSVGKLLDLRASVGRILSLRDTEVSEIRRREKAAKQAETQSNLQRMMYR